jgi:hypothetical protein
MPTPYEKIYENLLPKFRDYDIPIMSIDEVKDYLHDFLVPAISKFHVCKKDLNDRNDILDRFNCDLSDIEIEILSNYALLEYIDSTYIRTPMLLKVNLSSSDFNSYSPANMLDKLMSMRNKYLSENETLLTRYAWMNVDSGTLSKISKGYKKSKLNT